MDDSNQALLFLNRVPHRLSAVLQNAKQAPVVTIKVTELHALPHCGGPAESLVEHRPETPEATERELVFYKQNGGYTLLLGRKKFEAEGLVKVDEATAKKLKDSPREIRGRLLSTPALKKCRVEYPLANPEGRMDPVDSLDRGARTYRRDSDYQGNRMEIPQQRSWDSNSSNERYRSR